MSRVTLLGILFVVLIAGCGRDRTDDSDLVRNLQVAAMTDLLRDGPDRPLIPFEQGLVVVREELVQDLFNSVLPIEQVVAGRFRIRLQRAEATFEDGLALIRLSGVASLSGKHRPADVAVEISAVIEGVTLDAEARLLRARARVIAVNTHQLLLNGRQDRGWRGILFGFARLQARSFEGVAYTFDIPVRLESVIPLPELGPEGGVHIEKADLPLQVNVTDQRALSHRLWISVRLLDHAVRDSVGPSIEADAPQPAGSRARPREVAPGERSRVEEALRDALRLRVASDLLIADAMADTGQVAVALSEPFLAELVRETASIYLDQVALDLKPDIEETEEGSIGLGTPIGRLGMGGWNIELRVKELSGTMSAGSPRIDVPASGPILLTLPVRILGGRGKVTFDFEWKPRKIISLVCNGFRDTVTATGLILPQEHTLYGTMILATRGDSVLILPSIRRDRHPIEMTLSDSSWSTVERRLAEEDRLSRCGLLMNARKCQERLRQLGLAGIKIRLPAGLFPTVVLPARISRSVRILDQSVLLDLGANSIRSRRGIFWSSARIEVTGDVTAGPTDHLQAPRRPPEALSR